MNTTQNDNQKHNIPQRTNEEKLRFLNLRRYPASIEYYEAGWLLGFSEDEISFLTNKKEIPVQGNPSPNARKFLSTETIFALGKNILWLNKARKKVYEFRADKNRKAEKAAAEKMAAEKRKAKHREILSDVPEPDHAPKSGGKGYTLP